MEPNSSLPSPQPIAQQAPSRLPTVVFIIVALFLGVAIGYGIGFTLIRMPESKPYTANVPTEELTPTPTNAPPYIPPVLTPTATANETNDWSTITYTPCNISFSLPPKQAPYTDMEPTPTVPIGSQDPTKYTRYWKYYQLTKMNETFPFFIKISYGADKQYVEHEDRNYVIIACKSNGTGETISHTGDQATSTALERKTSSITKWGLPTYAVELKNGIYPYNSTIPQTHFFTTTNAYTYQIFSVVESNQGEIASTVTKILDSIKFAQ